MASNRSATGVWARPGRVSKPRALDRPPGHGAVTASVKTTDAEDRRIAKFFRASGPLWALIALSVAAALISPFFLQIPNLINIVRQVALFGIISIGMTYVMLTAGIDLSVGAIVGVVAVVTALLLESGWPIPVVMIVGLGVGAAIGAINGIGSTIGRIPPFIMTLGTMVMARGLALTLAKGQPVGLGEATDTFDWLGAGSWLGLPVPVWIFAFVVVVSIGVLRFTRFGRYVYAVGGNAEVARLAGINVGLVIFSVYVISGTLAGLTALIFVSRLTVGEPTAGTGLELEAIAVTVIGGTSLFGGAGGVFGTILGAGILAVLANIMNLTGISPFTQQIVKGAIIVIAVLFERFRRRQ